MESDSYRWIGEMLLYPTERDDEQADAFRPSLQAAPAPARELLERFAELSGGIGCEEYVSTLELAPKCPLYLGCYLFEEPSSCREAGSSARNAYMIELVNLYRHFGLKLGRRELPDFLPVMVDFLWLSLRGEPPRRAAALRRMFIEQYLAPALPGLLERLKAAGSSYALLVEGLAHLLESELHRIEPQEDGYVPLPVCSGCGQFGPGRPGSSKGG